MEDQSTDDILHAEAMKPHNKACFDCNATPAHWASTTYGIFLCLECAGKHRGLGTHLSKVRSLTLDRWDPPILTAMVLGGNGRARTFFNPDGYKSIFDKYSSDEASKYAGLLKKEVYQHLNLPEPSDESSARSSSQYNQRKQSFSSSSSQSGAKLDPRLRQYAAARSISSSDFANNDDDDSNGGSCWGCC